MKYRVGLFSQSGVALSLVNSEDTVCMMSTGECAGTGWSFARLHTHTHTLPGNTTHLLAALYLSYYLSSAQLRIDKFFIRL